MFLNIAKAGIPTGKKNCVFSVSQKIKLGLHILDWSVTVQTACIPWRQVLKIYS